MKKRVFTSVGALALLVASNHAAAGFIEFDLALFTSGDPIDASAKLNDETSGFISVAVQVVPEQLTGNIGDITGIFFNVDETVNESHINVTSGGAIIGFDTDTNNLGGGVNLNGGGPNNPGNFDVGIRFPGFNVDDVQLVEFTIADMMGALTLDDFTQFALRVQTVGPLDGSRGGSSKLTGSDPVVTTGPPTQIPEPSIALLFAAGLLGWSIKKRRPG